MRKRPRRTEKCINRNKFESHQVEGLTLLFAPSLSPRPSGFPLCGHFRFHLLTSIPSIKLPTHSATKKLVLHKLVTVIENEQNKSESFGTFSTFLKNCLLSFYWEISLFCPITHFTMMKIILDFISISPSLAWLFINRPLTACFAPTHVLSLCLFTYIQRLI